MARRRLTDDDEDDNISPLKSPTRNTSVNNIRNETQEEGEESVDTAERGLVLAGAGAGAGTSSNANLSDASTAVNDNAPIATQAVVGRSMGMPDGGDYESALSMRPPSRVSSQKGNAADKKTADKEVEILPPKLSLSAGSSVPPRTSKLNLSRVNAVPSRYSTMEESSQSIERTAGLSNESSILDHTEDTPSVVTGEPTLVPERLDAEIMEYGFSHVTQVLEGELAPDENELAARVAARLQNEMTPAWGQRLFANRDGTIDPETNRQMETGDTEGDKEDASDVMCGLQRKAFYILVSCLVLVVGATIGVVLALSRDSPKTTLPTTMAPTGMSDVRRTDLLEVLRPFLLQEDGTSSQDWALLLEDANSPQWKALAWMSTDDEFTIDALVDVSSADVLLERYVVVVLYYSMLGPDTTYEMPFMDGTTSVCAWNDEGNVAFRGIQCSSNEELDDNVGAVTVISLEEMLLQGTLPWEVSLLKNLTQLNLDGNNVMGTIPSQLAQLSSLQQLRLDSNAISGQIPREMSAVLESLHLNSNRLSGTLPVDWSDTMTSLTFLDLSANMFSGTIPLEWGALEQLTDLRLGENKLSGTIPLSLGSMTDLKFLYLYWNSLTGTLPTELGDLSKLRVLHVYGNPLNGTIPAEFSNLSQMTSFAFHNTTVTGSIDSVLCSMDGTLLEIQADCLGENAEVQCSCCLSCCLPHEDVCEVNTTLAISMRRSYLLDVLGPQIVRNDSPEEWALFEDPSTPQAQAIKWMSEEDEYSSRPEEVSTELLLERYALVVLYFSTSGQHWTNEFPFLDGSTSVCEWNIWTDDLRGGISCFLDPSISKVEYVFMKNAGLDGTIPWEISLLIQPIGITLMDNDTLGGTIPPEISKSSTLAFLGFAGNALIGTLPSALPELLQVLNLARNSLSGTIPSDWSSVAPSLTHLDIGNNKLEGTIPWESFTEWQGLETLSLYRNLLTGSLPTWLGAPTPVWSHLGNFYLFENFLTGPLPLDLGGYSRLKDFALFKNHFTGHLPQYIPESLEILNLFNNTLSGTIPNAWFISTNSSLEFLNLQINYLEGTIPSRIDSMTEMTILGLDRNEFTGTLPSQLGSLSKLEILYLDDNQFTGTVPEEFGSLRNLTDLWLKNTSLTGSLDSIFCTSEFDFPSEMYADCLGEDPELECSCCSTCCLEDGTGCVAM